MRLIQMNKPQAGEVLAKPLLLKNGNVLVGAGVKLSGRMIRRMRELGIDRVYIEDALTEGIEPQDVIEEETRQAAVVAVHKAMTQMIDSTLIKSRTASDNLGSAFRRVFNSILSDLSKRKNIMVNLASLNTIDGYLFHHAVNVAILAGIVGLSRGYNRQQLEDLGVGALLFDVGMAQIPKQLWNKNEPLTEEDRRSMESHTEKGYELLRNRFDISLMSAHCALQHHERFNGQGYPRGLKGREIHDYAQIVAIADAYDAMTSVRPHRNRFKPSEAIEYLLGSGNEMFDLELVKQFTEHVCIYPISTTVMLNTGQIGVVSANHQGSVQRPTIRVLRESDGTALSAPYEIDLREKLNVTIISSL